MFIYILGLSRMRSRKQYLDGIVGADIVLIDGLEPAHIVVSVGDQMDVDLAGDDPLSGVVGNVLGVGASGGGE